MYFFAIPMSMGDCLAGLGNLTEAEETYRSVFGYPFINARVEVVKLWTRLARVYLDQGDAAYRNAKDNAAAYAGARAFYERIVLGNRTLNPASPLYQDAKFAALRTRVAAFLAAADPMTGARTGDCADARGAEPDRAGSRRGSTSSGSVPTTPLFGSSTADHGPLLRQQASQIEQRHVQFKSTAENEELRREQLTSRPRWRDDGGARQRGVAECRGHNVAQATVNTPRCSGRTRSVAERLQRRQVELLELAMLEPGAAPPCTLTTRSSSTSTGRTTSRRRAAQSVSDLAGQRTRSARPRGLPGCSDRRGHRRGRRRPRSPGSGAQGRPSSADRPAATAVRRDTVIST
jgi:hypothetical protein